MDSKVSPAARLLQWWGRLRDKPGGHWLFTRVLSAGIPYTGTIHPHVLLVEPGHAMVQITERRRLRNHLNSIHALALANVGELTTGLAVNAALPRDVRSILTELRIQYLKKARGTVTAECTTMVPSVTDTIDFDATSIVTDEAGDTVATITASWRLNRMT